MSESVPTARPRGFSLIELMVTVAILAILMTLAAPSFADYFERGRLRAAADDVVSFINTNRLNATKFDRDIRLEAAGSGTAWCFGARQAADPAAPGQQVPAAVACDCVDDSAECLVDGVATVLSAANYGAAAQRPSIDAADIAITFDGRRGTLADFSTAGNVVLTSPSGNYQVRVDVLGLGQARVCTTEESRPISGFQSC